MFIRKIKPEYTNVVYNNNFEKEKFNPDTPSEKEIIEELDDAIAIAGYAYDEKQDIFYSTLDPWQRNMGYCHLYDEASAPMGMIIDCEPIYFNYRGKKWMISFWKGQYDLVIGGEIGMYTEGTEVNLPKILGIPSTFIGTFYTSVSNSDLLPMSFTLKKKGKPLFTREAKHWWLTGFRLGEFSEPSELSMDIKITFEDLAMRDAFVDGLKKTGYTESEYTLNGAEVSLTFANPHTPQPMTRTPETDRIIQRKNKELCVLFEDLTRELDTLPEKLKAIEEQDPDMYNKIMKLGKDHQYYAIFIAIIMAGTLLLTFLTPKSENKPLQA